MMLRKVKGMLGRERKAAIVKQQLHQSATNSSNEPFLHINDSRSTPVPTLHFVSVKLMALWKASWQYNGVLCVYRNSVLWNLVVMLTKLCPSHPRKETNRSSYCFRRYQDVRAVFSLWKICSHRFFSLFFCDRFYLHQLWLQCPIRSVSCRSHFGWIRPSRHQQSLHCWAWFSSM